MLTNHSDVSGGGSKPFKQKGTGRARCVHLDHRLLKVGV